MVELNRYKLTDEAEMSAANLQEVGRSLAEARNKRDRAEVAVKTVKASTELALRKGNPKDYGMEKFTEASITALVETNEEVLESKNDLLDTQEQVYILENDFIALRDKSDMIKELDKQWASGYFAGPSK
jgi:cell division GTPase FtsZ